MGKKTVCLLALLCGLLSIAEAQSPANVLKLTNGWQVQSSAKIVVASNQRQGASNQGQGAIGAVLSTPQAQTKGWYQATVPSTLMAVLIANGVEREALTADDYKVIDRSRFDSSWWYRTTFTLPRRQTDGRVLLSFDGISYRANIWLNGQQIATKEETFGTFRQFTFDITPYVSHENVLAVEVFRAQPGDPNTGFVDWNPRPADESMGLFREVTVKNCDAVSLAHTAVRSKVNKQTLDEAWLTIDTELTNLTDKEVKGTLKGCVDGRQLTTDVTLKPHECRLVTLASDLHVENARLWWCHNMGKAELYDLHTEFVDNSGTVSDSEDIRFGIREIESYLTHENYRQFRLNGRDVLLRGAGWTDDIYLRDTPATNRLQLEYVRDMNMNTVRLEGFWGNSQNLYDLCDELGLLVLVGWSCHWEWEEYIGTPATEPFGCITTPEMIEIVARSFKDQVRWLRHHPSIITWFVGSDRIPMPQLEQQYRDFLSVYDDRSYLISAKGIESTLSGFSGTKMEGPYEYVGPAYWYDPKAPGGAFGFNTETGVGAQLPVRESLMKMLDVRELSLPDDRWNILCTASASNMNTPSKLTEVIDGRFGASNDIGKYLHRADLLNYESTRAMFEAFRVNVPHTTGIIQWMLNSARPSIYWQLYDYYKQPNAAYYAVKRANQPVQLIYDYKHHAVYAVNETLEAVTINAYCTLYNASVSNQQSPINIYQPLFTVQPGTAVKAFNVPETEGEGFFLFLKATDGDDHDIAVNEYFIPNGEDGYLWEKSDWVGTPMSHYASYRMLDELPAVQCNATITKGTSNMPLEESGEAYTITLTNPSESVAFMIRLYVKNDENKLVYPAYWSDNYVTLAPGEQRTIICRMPETPTDAKLHFGLDGWNVKPLVIDQ